uniref:Allergen lipocalin Cav p 1 isoform 2 precusrsor n=1 Tax=Cavia porcellus TaxID=10141 RepID=A0A484HRI4_CAVPO|nr:allergen lipocalin Cav p 1 isoform 2 precusrsor [Cavia porcellus]
MVQILLLALAVGLSCVESSQISGDWDTIALSADNKEKIEEGGPLRVYFRQIDCNADCSEITFRLYVKLNGECKESTVVASQSLGGLYTVQFAGQNTFVIVDKQEDTITFFNTNVDENGLVTRGYVVVGKRDSLTPEETLSFEEANEVKGIPQENIEYLAGTDDCPE